MPQQRAGAEGPAGRGPGTQDRRAGETGTGPTGSEAGRLSDAAEKSRKALLRKAAALRDAADGSIRDCFEGLPEPRDSCGLRHPLPAVLTLVVMAMLNGKTKMVAVTAWIAHADQETLELAGCRHCGPDGRLAAPSPKTVTRCLALAGAGARPGL